MIARWLPILMLGGVCACATTASPSQRAGANYEAHAQHLRLAGYPVINVTTAPSAWNSNTGGETRHYTKVPGLFGEACQYGIGAPVPLRLLGATDQSSIIVLSGTAGDGSFSKALSEIKKAHPEVIALADVHTDMNTMAILSIFYKTCVQIHGTGLKATAQAPESKTQLSENPLLKPAPIEQSPTE